MKEVWCLLALGVAVHQGPVSRPFGEEPRIRVVRSGDDRLAGIREVDLLIEYTAGPAASCLLTVAPLRRAALERLHGGQIAATVSEKGRSSPYSVVASLRTDQTAATCATAVTTELVADVSALPEADKSQPPGAWGSLLVGYMPLVRESALVMTAAVEHDAAVRKALVAHIAAIATRIRNANP